LDLLAGMSEIRRHDLELNRELSAKALVLVLCN